MIKVHTLTLGAYQTNTYIIHDAASKKCCVIDPGYEPQTILDKLDALGLEAEAILLTHCHFDHVGAVKELAADTECSVYLCADDLVLPESWTCGKLWYTHTYAEGSTLNLAGLSIHVIHTPGHTPGSVCLLVENTIFSGDTLFAQGCGRTDLPGGDWAAILKSLRRLATFETNYWVCPGHGESTTLAMEKKYNPYLR